MSLVNGFTGFDCKKQTGLWKYLILQQILGFENRLLLLSLSHIFSEILFKALGIFAFSQVINRVQLLGCGMLMCFCKIIASPQFVRLAGWLGDQARVKGVSVLQYCLSLSLHSNQEIGIKRTEMTEWDDVLRFVCFMKVKSKIELDCCGRLEAPR